MNIKVMYVVAITVFVLVASGLINMAYQTSSLRKQLSDIKRDVGYIKDLDTKFKADVYTGMSALINGQKMMAQGGQALSLGQLRIHHFLEPHADKFYIGCQECEKEKKQIIEEDTITKENIKSTNKGN